MNAKVIFYDLETTGLKPLAAIQICEIGAVFEDQEFHQFLIPKCQIQSGATTVHGITKRGEKLFLNGSVITNAMNPEEGLKSFMDFLKSIVTGANKDEECILVAHNGARYDHTVLRNNLKRYRIQLPSFVCFADSMTLMKAYQQRTPFLRLSMNNLLQHFSGQKQNNKEGQHDALTDTRHLKNICLEGAKRLGFQNYLEYLEKNPEQIQRLTKSGNIKRPRKKKAIAFSMKKASKHRTNVDASADKISLNTSDLFYR